MTHDLTPIRVWVGAAALDLAVHHSATANEVVAYAERLLGDGRGTGERRLVHHDGRVIGPGEAMGPAGVRVGDCLVVLPAEQSSGDPLAGPQGSPTRASTRRETSRGRRGRLPSLERWSGRGWGLAGVAGLVVLTATFTMASAVGLIVASAIPAVVALWRDAVVRLLPTPMPDAPLDPTAADLVLHRYGRLLAWGHRLLPVVVLGLGVGSAMDAGRRLDPLGPMALALTGLALLCWQSPRPALARTGRLAATLAIPLAAWASDLIVGL